MKVCCFGATNIDIIIKSNQPLRTDDSMLSNISTNIGGVGCNIAYNLSMQKVQTKFISIISEDIFGQYILNSLYSEYLDLSDVQICNQQSSIYVDLNSELDNYGFNDMKIVNQICPKKILGVLNNIADYDYICVDLNIPCNILELIFQNSSLSIVCDATSIIKSINVLPYLQKIDTLKCSYREAVQIATKINKYQSCSDIMKLAEIILNAGVSQIYITLGKDGALFYSKKECYRITPLKKYDKHSLGAGDVFTAAIIYGLIKKMKPKDILVYASYFAMCAVQNDSTRLTTRDIIDVHNIMKASSTENLFSLLHL